MTTSFTLHIKKGDTSKVISGKDKVDLIKQRIKIDTKNLMQAREWMKKVKERFQNNS